MPTPSGRPGEIKTQLGNSYPVLKVIAGPGAGRVIRLQGDCVTIGRGEESDICIEDLGISRDHCQFIVETDRVLLKDLGSTNGTFIHGKRVDELELEDGMLITLGTQIKLRYAMLCAEEDELAQMLYESATLDVLTGILNRRAWLTRAKETLSQSLNQLFCVAIVDLDQFKSIHETQGSSASDAALLELSRRAAGLGRDMIAGRWQDEKFAFLLRNQSLEQASKRMEQLRQEIAASSFALGSGKSAPVTVSVGLSQTQPGEGNVESVISRAEKALGRAQEGGRNCLVVQVEDRARLNQKRVQTRNQCRIPVWCQADQQTFPGLVIDIGTGGLNLVASVELVKGVEIEVRPQEYSAQPVRLITRWRDDQAERRCYGTSFLESPDRLRTSWVSQALRGLGVNAHTARERRAGIRVSAKYLLKLESAVGIYTANLLDLGSGGLGMESPLIPAVGQQLTLEMAQLKASVRVVWAKPPRCGLSFVGLDERQGKIVSTLMEQAMESQRKTEKLP